MLERRVTKPETFILNRLKILELINGVIISTKTANCS